MDTILKINNLCVTLFNGVDIVKNISFEIKSGEVVALVGENGSGKSTILKAIMRDDETNKKISGSISYCGGTNILEMGKKELQEFRSKVAYVSQKDDYEFCGKQVSILDIMMDSALLNSKLDYTKEDAINLLEKYEFKIYDAKGKEKLYRKSSPSKLSGGQQRMLTIISTVAVRENSNLFIIDEPLNNLDFSNAKKVSNLITKIHKENPNAAILIITHCRIFPVITRLLTIKNGILVSTNDEYKCYNCFGEVNDEGYFV